MRNLRGPARQVQCRGWGEERGEAEWGWEYAHTGAGCTIFSVIQQLQDMADITHLASATRANIGGTVRAGGTLLSNGAQRTAGAATTVCISLDIVLHVVSAGRSLHLAETLS